MHAMTQRRKPVALGATRLADLFSSAANMVRRHSTVFVVSDFISEPGWEKPLGLLAQIPTLNREDLVSAIDRFQLQRGTAIGNSIVLSLATLFPDADIDLSAMAYGRERQRGVSIDQSKTDEKTHSRP